MSRHPKHAIPLIAQNIFTQSFWFNPPHFRNSLPLILLTTLHILLYNQPIRTIITCFLRCWLKIMRAKMLFNWRLVSTWITSMPIVPIHNGNIFISTKNHYMINKILPSTRRATAHINFFVCEFHQVHSRFVWRLFFQFNLCTIKRKTTLSFIVYWINSC